MNKIERFNGNVTPFASEAAPQERTIFGSLAQSNDINDQITEEFKRGWGIISANEFPSLQDFSALGYTLSSLISYLYQMGVPEWNENQTFHKASFATWRDQLWRCKTDNYTSPTYPNADILNWEPMFHQATGESETAGISQKAATESFAKMADMVEVLQYGSPLWRSIRAPFAKGTQVFYDGKQWLSTVNNNNTKPVGGNDKWYPISIVSNQLIRTPEPVSPITGGAAPALSGPLEASPYAPIYSVDSRDYRRFEVTTPDDLDFSAVVFTVDVDADTATISPALATTTDYIWRCKDVSVNGTESEYSEIQEFTTASTYIVAPSVISPTNNETGVIETPTIELSAFSVVGGVDTLAATSVRIKRKSDGVVVWSQDNTTPLNYITVPAGNLLENTEYTIEGKYHGTSLGESAWGLATTFATATNFVRIEAPTVIAPVNGATDIPEQPVIELSAFNVIAGTDTHTGTSVRIKDNMNAVIWSQDNTTPLNLITVPQGVLSVSSNYTIEAKYHGAALDPSEWGPASSFTTADTFLPSAPGAPYGGGYYAGKIKSDYDGLTYLLIISDGGGDSRQVSASTHAWRTTNSAVSTVMGTPPATMADGFANHAALKAAGIANFPAAKWIEDNCNAGGGLNGHTDWYLPSRDELEILYRAFKPDTTANNTSTRPTSGFGGDGKGYGTNDNSVPPMLRYTSGDPARTPFSNFQTGGTDAMTTGTYWSSSESGASTSWSQRKGSQFHHHNKNYANYVRAVRRILVS